MPVGACGPITIRASESRLLIGALAACLVLIGRPLSAFSAADEGRALLPGAPIEMELGQGAVRRHPIALEAGQLVEVTVREKGPRLAVVLLGPDGATVARRTVPSPRFTTIRMLAVTSAGGTHVLEVRSSAEE